MPIIKCEACGKKFSDGVTAFFPVDPPGHKGPEGYRRWMCDQCATPTVLANVPDEVMKITEAVAGRTLKEVE